PAGRIRRRRRDGMALRRARCDRGTRQQSHELQALRKRLRQRQYAVLLRAAAAQRVRDFETRVLTDAAVADTHDVSRGRATSDLRYPPIGAHGVIGDLRTAALVSTDATIDFLCAPEFDSPTVFASLIDVERGGSFSIELL